jgi:hypothetical protein
LNLIGHDPKVDRKKAQRGIYELALHVFSNGYRWDEDMDPHIWSGDEEPPWLTPEETDSYIICYPLEHRDLHRHFARLEGDDEEIIGFANKYGLLGHPVYLREQGKRLRLREGLTDGEPLAFWQKELVRMKNLLELWDIVRENERKLQKEVKRSESELGVGFVWKGAYYEVLSSLEWMPQVSLKDDKDIIGLVRYYIVKEINESLMSHCGPRLIENDGKCDVYMAPDCLLSAMYLLFAEELEGFDPKVHRVHYPKKKCKNPECRRAFSDRANKQFCSTSCKRHVRYLRRRARENAASKAQSGRRTVTRGQP